MPCLHALPADQLPLLRTLLPSAHADDCPALAYALEAAIAHTAPLTAWVDDAAHPRLAHLWDGRALHYLLGARTAANDEALAQHLTATVRPALARVAGEEPPFMLWRVGDPAWCQGEPFAPLGALAAYPRVAYLRPPASPVPQPTLPAGYRLVAIDAALLADDTLQLDSLRGEIDEVWPSVTAFLAHAWGYGVLWGRELVTWCTAEELSPARCGVGIWTHEAHRQRGLATAAAAAFAARCARQGCTALWDAWAVNAPSRRTAEGLGWALRDSYTVWVGQASA